MQGAQRLQTGGGSIMSRWDIQMMDDYQEAVAPAVAPVVAYVLQAEHGKS